MFRFLFRWIFRLALVAIICAALLAALVVRNEMACTAPTTPSSYTAILPPEHHRLEARTLLTYPEWHIVHAYDDYAKIIASGDPHEFSYFAAVKGFWNSLCTLSEQSATMGGVDWETKQMIYVIGVSFTTELMGKALYEETLGRLFASMRGPERAALDDLSADQARAYAEFLQQVPWYKWDFRADKAALTEAATDALRDQERRIVLGAEYGLKAVYGDAIGKAVANIGADELTLRMIVKNITPEALGQLDGVTVIATRPEGIEIETPRYRALTLLLDKMAKDGADFVEIAGNDDIMLTAISKNASAPSAIRDLTRQGYGDTRHLILLKVTDLAEALRDMENWQRRVEHIHDY